MGQNRTINWVGNWYLVLLIGIPEANIERFRPEGFDQIRPHSIRSLQFDQKFRPLSFQPEKFDLFTATPVLLNTMSEHLAAFVYLLFTYITSTLSWPDIWNFAFVTPIHKKEAVVMFKITGRSRNYPGFR